MNLINVNEKLCLRCGLCARICPVRVIKLSEASHLPHPGVEAEKLCINCGRCVDRCPAQALYHRYRKYGKKRPERKFETESV